MKHISTILLMILSMVVVACEGTIELGENVEFQQVASAASAAATPSDAKADTLGTPATTASEGEAQYQQNCAGCHGADATGGAAWPGSIVGFGDITAIVEQGRGNMPAINIDAATTASIQTWLDAQASSPAPVDNGTTPALQLYASTCAGCHGAEGEGSPNGPQLRYRDDDLSHFAVRNGRNGRGNPSAMPFYSTDEVSDADLDEILAWLSSFPNPTDGEGLYQQYCSNCHGADGLGGPSAKPLAGRFSVGDIVREGNAPGRFELRRDYMSAWNTTDLTDEEVDMIQTYMRSM